MVFYQIVYSLRERGMGGVHVQVHAWIFITVNFPSFKTFHLNRKTPIF